MRTELVRPLLVCALLVPALLLFADTLSYGFMSDDFYLVHRVSNEGFFTGWGGENGDLYFRPLTVFSYFSDYLIYGLNPAGWHLTNVLWHLVCSLLVFLLARVMLKDETAAFSAAYLFLLLACHSESVAWVSGRTDLLATAFCLGSVLAFLRKSPWALFLFAAGLLAKESVLITPLLWLVLVVKTPEWDSRAKRLFVISLVVVLVYTAARIVLSGGVPSGAGEVSFSVAAESTARYMFRVFVPPLSEAARPFLARNPIALPLFLLVTTAIALLFALRRNFDRRTFAVLVAGVLRVTPAGCLHEGFASRHTVGTVPLPAGGFRCSGPCEMGVPGLRETDRPGRADSLGALSGSLPLPFQHEVEKGGRNVHGAYPGTCRLPA